MQICRHGGGVEWLQCLGIVLWLVDGRWRLRCGLIVLCSCVVPAVLLASQTMTLYHTACSVASPLHLPGPGCADSTARTDCVQAILGRAKRSRTAKHSPMEVHLAHTLFLPAAVPMRRPLPMLSPGSRRPTGRYMPPDLQPHPLPVPVPNHTSASNYSPAAPSPTPQASFQSSAASNETTAEGSISLAGDLSVERSVELVEGSQEGGPAVSAWSPVVPEHAWANRMNLPGSQPDSPTADDELGSILAPAASSEVYVSATEDTPTSSSDGHAGSPFGDSGDADFMGGLTPRVTTFMGGPLPTVTEEPHMEDGASRQASREGSSGLLALTAQNSASVSSTPVAFGSVATQSGSLHSRASPRDAAPSSTDSSHAVGAPLSATGSRPRSSDAESQSYLGSIANLPEQGVSGPLSSGVSQMSSPSKGLPGYPAATPPHLGASESPGLPTDLKNTAMAEASGSWLYGQAMAVVNGLSPRDGTVDSVTEHLIQSEGSMSHGHIDGAHTAPLRPYPESIDSSKAGATPSSTSHLSTSVDLAMSRFEAERLRSVKMSSSRSADGGAPLAPLVIDDRLAAATLARLHVREGWAAVGPSNPHIVTTGVPGESPGRGSGTTISGEAQLASETAGASTSTGNGTPRKSLDSHSDMSLVVDSEGRPMACLRNQPRLPRTAFLSTVPSAMLTANMVEQGPMSSHTTPRSGATGGSTTTADDPTLTATASPAASPQRGSSAFDSALLHRSDDEELRPTNGAQGPPPEVCLYDHTPGELICRHAARGQRAFACRLVPVACTNSCCVRGDV